ncbi:hypothetical protein BJ878DRAFT_208974 [Calycina marina]|uniref:Uncharacterized protein n=1 Tax=Calycina marina TaxID=1763456 RepID=A0A9P8CCA7_9HELO|nr:hypothetical protein BJ878DRAFT_208974 [Calycina marina]
MESLHIFAHADSLQDVLEYRSTCSLVAENSGIDRMRMFTPFFCWRSLKAQSLLPALSSLGIYIKNSDEMIPVYVNQSSLHPLPDWVEHDWTLVPFIKYYHEPFFFVTTETENDWQTIRQAHTYFELNGKPHEDEPGTVKEGGGGEGDVVVLRGFKFEYRKDASINHGAIKVARMEIMSDSALIVTMLVKRVLYSCDTMPQSSLGLLLPQGRSHRRSIVRFGFHYLLLVVGSMIRSLQVIVSSPNLPYFEYN